MNLIAIDIGNTNIKIGLFMGAELKAVEVIDADDSAKIADTLKSFWNEIPIPQGSADHTAKAAVAASCVDKQAGEKIREIVENELDQQLLVIGEDIPFPVELAVDEPGKLGTDRVLTACAAYAVAEKAVVVADFGTAVTIDLVDDRGVFLGGTIIPGFEIAAKALHEHTAQLPKVKVKRPELPWGENTEDAINAGLFYSATGTLEEIVRKYSEKIGTWPRTIITGTGAKIIKDDCPFVDSYVPNLVIKGIALAYRKQIDKYAEEETDQQEE